jgi:uncharacterized membrane-anchored protein YhcB (DUF1043 family)
MKGKIGLIIGLAAGYVLGTRAGRERYEQIKTEVDKLWNLDQVQDQVDRVKDFAKTTASALPSTLWDGAVKATKATKAATSKTTSGGAKGNATAKTSTGSSTGANRGSAANGNSSAGSHSKAAGEPRNGA